MLRTRTLIVFLCVVSFFVANLDAQETPPAPSASKAVTVPAIKEKRLANGLTVAVIERKGVPLVAVQLLIDTGVTYEEIKTAGLVNMAMGLLTKGTKTRNATKVANDIEFLGGSIGSNVGLDSSSISLSVTSDKITQGLSIMSDVVRNPTFPELELKLAKSQAVDELANNLKQPGFIANYVATTYSFYGNPSGGTPESLAAMKRSDIVGFYRESFSPERATLIFVGDIDAPAAFVLAQTQFGSWTKPRPKSQGPIMSIMETADSVQVRQKEREEQPLVKRLLVIDLPKSGQAAVSFTNHLQFAGHVTWNEKANHADISKQYFPGIVLNSILGGGYSSRLNMEIRINRGLSYGAGSSINWRMYDSRFSARTQTKNESAAQVAEILVEELKKLGNEEPDDSELAPRQAVLIGSFGRSLETNFGLLDAVSQLYSNSLNADELNSYLKHVKSVNGSQVRDFAIKQLNGGDIIIVGDYLIFKDDLAKRFPGMKVDVIKADELDLSKDNLRK